MSQAIRKRTWIDALYTTLIYQPNEWLGKIERKTNKQGKTWDELLEAKFQKKEKKNTEIIITILK